MKVQPFCSDLVSEKIDTRHVAARPSEAHDQAKPDRSSPTKNSRGRRGCGFGRHRHIGISKRGYHCDLTANQIGRQRGRLSPALKVTGTSSQTAEKRGQVTFRDETG